MAKASPLTRCLKEINEAANQGELRQTIPADAQKALARKVKEFRNKGMSEVDAAKEATLYYLKVIKEDLGLAREAMKRKPKKEKKAKAAAPAPAPAPTSEPAPAPAPSRTIEPEEETLPEDVVPTEQAPPEEIAPAPAPAPQAPAVVAEPITLDRAREIVAKTNEPGGLDSLTPEESALLPEASRLVVQVDGPALKGRQKRRDYLAKLRKAGVENIVLPEDYYAEIEKAVDAAAENLSAGTGRKELIKETFGQFLNEEFELRALKFRRDNPEAGADKLGFFARQPQGGSIVMQVGNTLRAKPEFREWFQSIELSAPARGAGEGEQTLGDVVSNEDVAGDTVGGGVAEEAQANLDADQDRRFARAYLNSLRGRGAEGARDAAAVSMELVQDGLMSRESAFRMVQGAMNEFDLTQDDIRFAVEDAVAEYRAAKEKFEFTNELPGGDVSPDNPVYRLIVGAGGKRAAQNTAIDSVPSITFTRVEGVNVDDRVGQLPPDQKKATMRLINSVKEQFRGLNVVLSGPGTSAAWVSHEVVGLNTIFINPQALAEQLATYTPQAGSLWLSRVALEEAAHLATFRLVVDEMTRRDGRAPTHQEFTVELRQRMTAIADSMSREQKQWVVKNYFSWEPGSKSRFPDRATLAMEYLRMLVQYARQSMGYENAGLTEWAAREAPTIPGGAIQWLKEFYNRLVNLLRIKPQPEALKTAKAIDRLLKKMEQEGATPVTLEAQGAIPYAPGIPTPAAVGVAGRPIPKTDNLVLDMFQGGIEEDANGNIVRLGNTTDVSFRGWMNPTRFLKATQVPEGLMSAFETTYPEAFDKDGNINATLLIKGLRERPMTEVKLLGKGAQEQGATLRRLREVEHELDTIQPGWRGVADSYQPLNFPTQQANDLASEWRDLMDLSETTEQVPENVRFAFVAPKSESEMPGYVEALVRVPLTRTPEQIAESKRIAEAIGEDPMLSNPALYSGPHFGAEDHNVLAFFRGYEETLPDGRKAFHVIEVQSDWAQERRRWDETSGKVNRERIDELTRRLANGEGSERQRANWREDIELIKNDQAQTKDHPLLSMYETLALKAAIQHARSIGAEAIVLSDGETAMMSEGHDKVGAPWVLETANPQAAERAAERAGRYVSYSSAVSVEGNKVVVAANSFESPDGPQVLRELGFKEAPAEPKQAEGMRLHYDRTLPDTLAKLTGDKKPGRVDLGVHSKALQVPLGANPPVVATLDATTFAAAETEFAQKGYDSSRFTLSETSDGRRSVFRVIAHTPGSPVFRNPDGTPKSNITGRVFSLGKINQGLQKNPTFNFKEAWASLGLPPAAATPRGPAAVGAAPSSRPRWTGGTRGEALAFLEALPDGDQRKDIISEKGTRPRSGTGSTLAQRRYERLLGKTYDESNQILQTQLFPLVRQKLGIDLSGVNKEDRAVPEKPWFDRKTELPQFLPEIADWLELGAVDWFMAPLMDTATGPSEKDVKRSNELIAALKDKTAGLYDEDEIVELARNIYRIASDFAATDNLERVRQEFDQEYISLYEAANGISRPSGPSAVGAARRSRFLSRVENTESLDPGTRRSMTTDSRYEQKAEEVSLADADRFWQDNGPEQATDRLLSGEAALVPDVEVKAIFRAFSYWNNAAREARAAGDLPAEGRAVQRRDELIQNAAELGLALGRGVNAFKDERFSPGRQVARYAADVQTKQEPLKTDPEAQEIKKVVEIARDTAATQTTTNAEPLFQRIEKVRRTNTARETGVPEGDIEALQGVFDFFENGIKNYNPQSPLPVKEQIRKAAADTITRQVMVALGLADRTTTDRFTDKLAQEVRSQVTAQLKPLFSQPSPTGKEMRPGNQQDIERILNAVDKLDLAESVFNSTIANLQNELGDGAFAGARFDRAKIDGVTTFVRQRGNLRDVVRRDLVKRGATLEQLQETIRNEARGLTDAQAESVAKAIEVTFNEEVQRESKKQLEALANRQKAGAAKRVTPQLIDRLLGMVNLGAFSSPKYYNAIAKSFELPEYDPAVADEITQRAEDIQRLINEGREGFQVNREMSNLLSYIEGQNRGALDVGVAMFYANILSGYTTQMKNLISTALNTVAEIGTRQLARRATDPFDYAKVLGAFARGLQSGTTEAVNILKTGQGGERVGQKIEALRVLETNPFQTAVANSTRVAALPAAVQTVAKAGAWTLDRWKLVHRLMQATDMALYRGAETARAYMMASDLVEMEGIKDPTAASRRIADIVYGTGTTDADGKTLRDRAEERATAEGLKGLEQKIRVAELIEQARPANIRQEASDFGGRATFNHKPMGLLGELAAGISRVAEAHPAVRFVVPFTHIVANVTNAALDYTPAGFHRAGVLGFSGWEGRNKGEDKYQQIVKATLGTAALASLYLLSKGGEGDDDELNEPRFRIHGAGPQDKELRKQKQEAGWMPYSIEMPNGRYYSFLNSPLAVGMAIVGNVRDAETYKQMDEAAMGQRLAMAVALSGKAITQQSFLSGVSDLFRVLDSSNVETSGKGVENLLARTASSIIVPNLLKQVERSFVNERVYEPDGLWQAFLRDVPFARTALRPAINILGEDVTRSPINQFTTTRTADPVWAFLSTGNLRISAPSKAAPFGDRTMTAEEHYQLVKESGLNIRSSLENEALRARLSALDQEQAQEILDSVVQAHREAVKAKLRAQAARAGTLLKNQANFPGKK